MATIELEIPDGLDPELTKRRLEAELSHGAAVQELADMLQRSDHAISPAAAASAAGVEQFWRRMIATYGVYTATEIASLRGSNPKNRSVAANFAKRHGVLGVLRGRAKVYPRFQFRGPDVHPDWTRLSAPLHEAGWSAARILYWAGSPNGYVDNREPAALIGTADIDDAVDAAQDSAHGFTG
ncbi:hypothetical protein [Garicola koreensis]|uniref:Antitoxin Xre/MbcA/ParS-like toxin-binding domain-containing protein n=1 Tax=Garicola koreensis TaxID=1262554 RepID=A0A7W5TXD1_9MICC|nr:hypothetical protein [Garicola koreensis]MBB3668449.1 hypothetical protein [Garicola koreensis]